MQLDKTLYNEINEYCKLNDLKPREFIHKILKEAFLKEKYGESPFKFNNKNNQILNNNDNNIGNNELLNIDDNKIIALNETPKESITSNVIELIQEDKESVIDNTISNTQQINNLDIQDNDNQNGEHVIIPKPRTKRKLK